MASSSTAALHIAEEVARCGIRLVASLPDNWIAELIRTFDGDDRFEHVPVNREESAIGLCSGAFFSGIGSVAVMGASGFMTVVYALTKINYTYEVPLLALITLRGEFGDHHKHHVSNGLYLRRVMDAINIPYAVVESADRIGEISRAWEHTRTYSRPAVVAFTRPVLMGEA